MSQPGIYRGRALRNAVAGEFAEFIVGERMDAEQLAAQLAIDIRLYGRAYTVRGADGLVVRLSPASIVVHVSGKDAP